MPRILRWGVLVVVPALAGIASIALQRASGVTLMVDEMGFLGEAVALSARDAEPVLSGMPFYSAGWPALLALPLSVVPVDPWVVAVGTNVALLGLLGPVLYALVRCALQVSEEVAVVAAITGAVTPSVVLQSPRAWSEIAVGVGFAVWALALARFTARPSTVTGIAAGVATGVLFGLHRRFLVVLALTAVAFVVTALWRSAGPESSRAGAPRWVAAGVALVALVLSASAALRLDAYVVDRLYDGVTSGDRLGVATRLWSTAWLPTLLGHLWSALAVTVCLAGVGVVALGDLLRRRTQPVWAATVLLSCAGVVVTSALFLSATARADAPVYERYMAPTFPVLLASAIVFMSTASRAVRRFVFPGCIALLVMSGAVLEIWFGESELTGAVQRFTVPALSGLDLPSVGWGEAFAGSVHAAAITALAAGAAVLVWLAGTRLRSLAGAAVLCLVAALASAGALAPFANQWEPAGRAAADVIRRRDPPVLAVTTALPDEVRTLIHYRLGYMPLQLIEPESLFADCPAVDTIVAHPFLEDSLDYLVPIHEVEVIRTFVYAVECDR